MDDITMDLADEEKIREEIMARAYRLRAFMDAHAGDIDDEQAVDIPDLMPLWNPGETYARGDRVRYGSDVYKVLQSHTAQRDWAPDIVPALYAKLRSSQEQKADDEGIAEWVQPSAENPYERGERVLHGGLVYESLVDGNVWEPTEQTCALSLWKQIELD